MTPTQRHTVSFGLGLCKGIVDTQPRGIEEIESWSTLQIRLAPVLPQSIKDLLGNPLQSTNQFIRGAQQAWYLRPDRTWSPSKWILNPTMPDFEPLAEPVSFAFGKNLARGLNEHDLATPLFGKSATSIDSLTAHERMTLAHVIQSALPI